MPIEFHRDGPWELPAGWVWASLRDLVSLRGEKAPPDRNSTFHFVGMDDVPSNSLRIETMGEFRSMKSAGNKFYPNDVLYGRLRPYLNKVVVADFEGVASGEFIVMRPEEGIEPRYLQFFMHARRFVNSASADTSGDRPRIDFDKIAEVQIPSPHPPNSAASWRGSTNCSPRLPTAKRRLSAPATTSTLGAARCSRPPSPANSRASGGKTRDRTKLDSMSSRALLRRG
jgi:hypothetical protein